MTHVIRQARALAKAKANVKANLKTIVKARAALKTIVQARANSRTRAQSNGLGFGYQTVPHRLTMPSHLAVARVAKASNLFNSLFCLKDNRIMIFNVEDTFAKRLRAISHNWICIKNVCHIAYI